MPIVTRSNPLEGSAELVQFGEAWGDKIRLTTAEARHFAYLLVLMADRIEDSQVGPPRLTLELFEFRVSVTTDERPSNKASIVVIAESPEQALHIAKKPLDVMEGDEIQMGRKNKIHDQWKFPGPGYIEPVMKQFVPFADRDLP